MTAQHLDTWLGLLQSACEQADTRYLYVIVDQAGSEVPLLPSVVSVEPPLAWYSLFSGLPEEGAEDLAPLLVRVELAQPLQRQWLLGVMHATDGHSQLLVLASTWPFAVLAEHLGHCMEARNGGRLGLLRYYDPRLFPLLFSHVLQPEQQQPWLHPALFWSWLDRDSAPQHLLGMAAPNTRSRLRCTCRSRSHVRLITPNGRREINARIHSSGRQLARGWRQGAGRALSV